MENNEIMTTEVLESTEEQDLVVTSTDDNSNGNGVALLVLALGGATLAGIAVSKSLSKLTRRARDKFEDRIYENVCKRRAEMKIGDGPVVDIEPEEIQNEE